MPKNKVLRPGGPMPSHALLPLLCFLAVALLSNGQEGFISIDCGLKEKSNYTVSTGVSYWPDTGYVDGGVNVDVTPPETLRNLGQRYFTMRSFPNGTRNCYNVGPVKEDERYLVRAGFLYGNYDGRDDPPEFDLYLGVDLWQTVTTLSNDTVLSEIIALATSASMQVCLVNTGKGTPFISVLEVRPLNISFYSVVSPTLSLVLRDRRVDYGGTVNTRYPADPCDRLWFGTGDRAGWKTVATDREISRDNGAISVPQSVMRTGVVSEDLGFTVTVGPEERIILVLYFAELERLAENETREFNVLQDGQLWNGPYRPTYLSGETLYTKRSADIRRRSYAIKSTVKATLPPIINAREVYGAKQIIPWARTDSLDVEAINKIKEFYKVNKNWQGDPCFPKEFAWESVGCRYDDLKHPRIVALNLSGNGLQGVISPSIVNLTALISLDLSYNNLRGEVSEELLKLQNLQVLNLTSNQLTGLLPDGLYKKSENDTLVLGVDGNLGLCKSLELCGSSSKKKNNIVPIVAGTSVSAAVVLGVIILVWILRVRSSSIKGKGSRVKRKQQHFNSQSHEFSFSDILTITRNFERMVGKGGFATVYYGILNDKTEVAVKLLSESSHGRKDFHSEGQILTRVHHKNLVRLLGYCDDEENLALVYEYMGKGSLADHLTGSGEDRVRLNWGMRLRIAVDVAQGLDYLHRCCKPSIVHRDIKTRNILLNGKLEAKLGDFGLSKLFSHEDDTHVSTVIAGTPGYLDPEYCQTFKLTEKSDVYSFGIVLLEIISGQRPISNDKTLLVHRVQSRREVGDISSIVDPCLAGDYDLFSLRKTIEVAMACASPASSDRPQMSEVVSQLKECLESVASHDIFRISSSQIYNPIDTSLGGYDSSVINLSGR